MEKRKGFNRVLENSAYLLRTFSLLHFLNQVCFRKFYEVSFEAPTSKNPKDQQQYPSTNK